MRGFLDHGFPAAQRAAPQTADGAQYTATFVLQDAGIEPSGAGIEEEGCRPDWQQPVLRHLWGYERSRQPVSRAPAAIGRRASPAIDITATASR
jgi:hypothetical protein